MPRAKANKLYRTFTKGLITEAGYLTYPEDASLDELNTVISRKGNRTRRTGIDYQDNYILEDLGITPSSIISEHIWNSVNNDATVNFVVIQVDATIYFYRLDEEIVSASLLPFSIDLTDYLISGASLTELSKNFADFTSGVGFLFIAHRNCVPISVAYNVEDNDIEVLPITIEVRDLEGIDDGLPNDAEPTQLSPEHHYNLMNQGWLAPGSNKVTGTGIANGEISIGVGSSVGGEGQVN